MREDRLGGNAPMLDVKQKFKRIKTYILTITIIIVYEWFVKDDCK